MIILKRLSIWMALLGMGFTIWILLGAAKKEPMPTPVAEPPRAPYSHSVAASGIIEAVNENVRIAPPVAGLITKMFVTVGDQVTEGAPLFQLDDRDLQAQLVSREAAIPPIQAQIQEQQYRIGDLDTQLKRLKSVHDQRAVSEDEMKRTWYALEMAKRTLVRFQANLQQVIAQRDEIQILLDRLLVKAPRAGTILQVNMRAGEYATLGATEPLLLLGDMQQLQVRADVDEVNAPLVAPRATAVASLKSQGDTQFPLSFVRIEPYVVPKKSLTGDNSERVDTRVLQIIYRFERPSFPVYAGQQVDVFIQRDAATPEAPVTRSSIPPRPERTP